MNLTQPIVPSSQSVRSWCRMIALHLGELLDWRAGLIRSDYTAISIVIISASPHRAAIAASANSLMLTTRAAHQPFSCLLHSL